VPLSDVALHLDNAGRGFVAELTDRTEPKRKESHCRALGTPPHHRTTHGVSKTGGAMTVDQTVLHTDPRRPGNCFAACVATALGRPLRDVPHFVEWGQMMHNGKLRDDDDPDRKLFWSMFLGYCAGARVWPVDLDSVEDALDGELVFAAGPSPRGTHHQVLYRDGQLWHDPHPSRDGLLAVEEAFVLRPPPAAGHDHDPTPQEDQ
ncbi:hypothetical protein, partial [Allisonella histaminiformans]|uniref:hypothetical protein n=1 Tax=Allisonella histaminiformans TaxID=209880 RepID=UPI003F899B86